ncbi:conserved hypothetical protein [Leishmania mexicana MHOM/GT/2001/U1103]|uniref:Uncharacterized protein n=1 Tax=Leishmania mexicana (strain MHOM/GT/2001/U1103) TaxID=929439 RepID=E9AM80_LEIMU|nr:conserved hypothetical protein [Leishmania mexicana MHOM/GT/2001/U1103]CBZ24035.1 conserved hypothetical protein [Leishmania mexicana MHOM/GT/2001/U1103]
MSKFFWDAGREEGSLQGPLLNAPRKRCREENYAIDAYPRHLPPHVRVQVAWENTTTFVSLRGHVLDPHGCFNSGEFPGLAFFYNPVVACVASGTVTLHLDNSASATERILREERPLPCPVHGPFRCPCHIMHEAADGVAQLLREIFCQHSPFDVSIDCHRPYPHISIDSQARTWSVSLVGLPLPPKSFGPFPLGNITSPQSIKIYWFQYIEKSKVIEDACVMCGVVSGIHCSRCLCRLCQRCGEHCANCGSYVCRGCSTAGENGTTICYNCPR